MKEVIQGVIDGTNTLEDLEKVIAENYELRNSSDNKQRGIYRLATLLMESPEKAKDGQFLDRFKQLSE
jgi:hypothetical protein